MFRKITTILLVCLLSISLMGCSRTTKAESAVEGMLQSFKNLDFKEAKTYMDNQDTTNINDFNKEDSAVLEGLFDKFNYEILSTELLDANNAIVKVKITTPDMKYVVTDLIGQIMNYIFSNIFADPQPSVEEMTEKMEEMVNECFSDPDLKILTYEIDVKVRKNENGEWKITMDDVLMNSILGGLLEAAEKLVTVFEEVQ